MFTLRRFLALFRRPQTPLARAERAIAFGRYDRALMLLDRLLQMPLERRAQIEAANKRGVVLVHLGRRDEARAAFEAVVAAAPRFAQARVNLGNLELEAGAAERAIAAYESALIADPDCASAYRHLGIAYKRLGRTAEAVRALKQAGRLEGRARRRITR